ncbi:MAG: hypothetical protein DWQ06_04875 [Calditrichaeota bacterium]|nr:MAG: hypothetical protein DWQ06_04875 [Calditrichota bacterium]
MRKGLESLPSSEMPQILEDLIFGEKAESKNILEFPLPTHYSNLFEKNFQLALKSKRVLLHVDFTLEAVCSAVLLYKILKQNGVSPSLNFATRENEGFGNQFKILLNSSKLKNVDFVLICGFSQKPEIPNSIHFPQNEEIFSENPVTLVWTLVQKLNLGIPNELPLLLAFQNGFTALVGSNFEVFSNLRKENLEIQLKELCLRIENLFEIFEVEEKTPKCFEEQQKFLMKILVNALRFGRSELVFKVLTEGQETKQLENCLKILIQKYLQRKSLLKLFEEKLQNGNFEFYGNDETDFCVLVGHFELGFLRIFARTLANKTGKNSILISTKLRNEKIGTIFGLDSFKRNFFNNFEVYFKNRRLTKSKCWFRLRGLNGKEIFEILQQL